MNLLQLRFTHLYTLIGSSEGVPPSRNESPWRMVRRSAGIFRELMRSMARGVLHLVSDSTQYVSSLTMSTARYSNCWHS